MTNARFNATAAISCENSPFSFTRRGGRGPTGGALISGIFFATLATVI
jgi:hypothetical protein